MLSYGNSKFFSFLLALVLWQGAWTYASERTNFPLYLENEHFQIFCEEKDQAAANQMLQILESHFGKLSKDFEHLYTDKIHIHIFPTIEQFHEAIHWPSAPAWIVANSGDGLEPHTFFIVSPVNPGTYHSFESILKISVVNLTKLFIADKYKKHSPYWLRIGIAFHEAGMVQKNLTKRLIEVKNSKGLIPTLHQLETVPLEEFNQIGGYSYAYALAEFIIQTWGWEKVLALLDDYSSFESVLEVSKQDFRELWINFLMTHYTE